MRPTHTMAEPFLNLNYGNVSHRVTSRSSDRSMMVGGTTEGSSLMPNEMPLGRAVQVLVADEHVEPSLAATADRHGWEVKRVTSVAEAARHVSIHQPSVLIVQMTDASSSSMQLIVALRRHLSHLPLITVAFCDLAQCELPVRQAGAYCYFPDSADHDCLAQMVAEMLTHPTARHQPPHGQFTPSVHESRGYRA